MFRIGLLIIAVWPAIGIAQNTYSLKDPDRSYFQSRELSLKEKHNQAIQKWENFDLKLPSILDQSENLLKGISRKTLLREHSDQAIEDFFDQDPTNPNKSATFLLLGLEAFRDKQYASTIKYFQSVSTTDLNGDQAEEFYFKSGYAFLMEKQVEPALSSFNKIKGKPGGYGPPAAYYAGYLEFESGNYSAAKQNLALVGDDPAFSKTVNDLMAVIYYKEGDSERLIAFAEELEKKGGKKGHIKNLDLLVGDAYFARNDFQLAWNYFERGEPKRASGLSADLAYRYGRTLFEIGDFEKAEKYLKVGVSKSKNDTLTMFCSYFAGVNSSRLSDNASAVIFFDQASKYDFHPGLQENAVFNSAKLRIKGGFTSQAISWLSKYLKVFPKGTYREEASELLAEAYLNSNRYFDGLSHLEELQVWNNRNKVSFQRLCFNYASEKFNDRAFDSAIFYFEKSLRFPQDLELQLGANFWMGEAASVKKNWSKSILYYGRVFRIDKNSKSKFYYPSRYGIAFAYFKSKDYEKARGHYKAYVDNYGTKGGKNYEDALLRLADSYFVLRDYANSAEVFKTIFNRGYKGRDYAAFRLGEIYWIENQGALAKQYFGKIPEQYPTSPYLDDALYENANVSFESGDFQKAVLEYSNLIQSQKRSPYISEAYHKRGMSYAGLNKNNPAIKDFRFYLSKYPRNKKAVEVLSSLHEALIHENREGEFEDDKIAFQRANPESKALESIEFENGKEFHLAGEIDRAILLLSKFIQDYPNSSFREEAVFFMAEDYYSKPDFDSSYKYYQEVIEFGSSENLKTAFEKCSRIDLQRGNFSGASTNLAGWIELASGDEERIIAQEGLMRSYYAMEEYDSSLNLAIRISGFESPFGNRNLALLFWGKSLLKLGKLDEAKSQFEKTVNEATDENAAEALYLIASIQFQLAEFKESIQTCLDLISAFSHYAEWNDKSFLLIADNFIGLEDLFQARSTLESIIENSPSDTTVEEARKKLLIVQEKEELMNQMTDSIE